MLGGLTGGGLRGYYKMENANDSSPNGFNLSTSGTVNYVLGRFQNAANFGNSGTTPGLYYGANVLSSATVNELFVSCLVKFNSTANTSRNHFLWEINTRSSATTGRRYFLQYTITGGVMTLRARRNTTLGVSDVTTSFTPNTSDWYRIQVRYASATGVWVIAVISNREETISSNFITNVTTGVSLTANPTIFLSIGNSRTLTQSAYAVIEEVIISDSIYTQQPATDGGIDQSNRSRYGNQLRAFNV